MKDKLICVYSHNNRYLVDILKAVLADNAIESFILNKQDSSYHFGDIELYVNPQDESVAKKIIIEFDSNHEK